MADPIYELQFQIDALRDVAVRHVHTVSFTGSGAQVSGAPLTDDTSIQAGIASAEAVSAPVNQISL